MTKSNIIFITLLFILSLQSFAQNYKRTVITDPSISRRCTALIEKRNKKVFHKQRLTSLLIRNERLQKMAPRERKSVLSKLKRNLRSLNEEMRLTLLQIQNQEENIIRKGCPGINL